MKKISGKISKTIIVCLFIFIFIVLIFLPVGWFYYTINTPIGGGIIKNFEIKEGDSAGVIAQGLEGEDLIRSSIAFKLLVKMTKTEGLLRKGWYQISSDYSIKDILSKITKGTIEVVKITIPEGFTLNDINALLEEKKICQDKAFYKLAVNNKLPVYKSFIPETLEGYLFPDTYFLGTDTSSKDFIEIMLKRFQELAIPLYESKSSSLSFVQIITLASLIEKEAKVAEERPIISSVYYNRLKKGMLLQCDATVLYALKKHKELITFSDLEIDSPYNTYKYPGLPPGPIANPGLESIKSAVNPAETKYLYYVLNEKKGDGSHVFTGSYSEHLEAIRSVSP